MSIEAYLRAMPKVELHVHMEGSIRPETLLKLAERHKVLLPAHDLDELQNWYTFTDFGHFLQIYKTIGTCLRTQEDIELITREFLVGQAEQNIIHSEVTYTPYHQYKENKITFEDQLSAINRGRTWAEENLGVSMTLTVDISREIAAEEGLITAEWAVSGMDNGVTALGLGGPEIDNPPEKFVTSFEKALAAGLHSLPHAGETEGPASIWGALNSLKAERIGHGIRCLEDPALVEFLVEKQIPLEVCPTSNLCLKVAPSIEKHPLPRLLEAGLYITINSDDPPMFNTTLNDEYVKVAKAFNYEVPQMEKFSLNALRASLLPQDRKNNLLAEFTTQFAHLRQEHGIQPV